LCTFVYFCTSKASKLSTCMLLVALDIAAQASYTSSLRPHTLVASGLIH
jgi:hypothetical protein